MALSVAKSKPYLTAVEAEYAVGGMVPPILAMPSLDWMILVADRKCILAIMPRCW